MYLKTKSSAFDWARGTPLVCRVLGWFVFTSAVGCVGAAAPDYRRDIKPLLARECVKCHGASQQKGDLRLDTAAAALNGGKNGPALKLRDSSASLLIRVIEGTHAEIPRMPYKRGPLDSAQIALLKSWIDNGAKFPADEAPSSDQHWAFVPPKHPPVPALVSRKSQIVNPIDAFVLARLEAEGLEPSPPADKATLLRRVSLDLTGLPPTPEEIADFLADARADAFERVVDRLLSSAHYGERWGRWWLDAARYADSNGYSIDSPRSIWPFRDWVVRALNADMPFDRFTIWQLAGDLVSTNDLAPHESPLDPLIATGFHRNTQVNHEGGIDPEQFRIESVMDRVNTTATVWLGLTLACAQCHDHKFDPLTQRDYYRFFAYFNSCENDGHGNPALEATNTIDLGTSEELAALAEHRKQLKQREKELSAWVESDLKPRQPAWESGLDEDRRNKLKSEVRVSLAVPVAERNEFQRDTVFNTFRDQDDGYRERRKAIDELRKGGPKLPTTLVMRELAQPREAYVLIKGDFTRRGEKVEPGTPEALAERETRNVEHGTRLDLARWIVAPENPLTARVIMNRVWQQYFGKGLVETENDFGTMGTPPTHPDLLDWLATEFIARGWSLKAMHRLIVTSATYRQSSKARPELAERDPSNKLLARQNRLRLDAEIVRDTTLAASGLLEPRLGGPPVFPPQPEGLGSFTQNDRPWKPSTGPDRYRRAIYTHLQRTTFHPALGVFDAADGYQVCTRRIRSNTPLQALTLLNDAAFHEIACAFAKRLHSAADDDAARLERGFLLALGRSPSAVELERLTSLLSSERAAGASESESWQSVARVLLNLDEAITRE